MGSMGSGRGWVCILDEQAMSDEIVGRDLDFDDVGLEKECMIYRGLV
jgi:hypothetical protein